MDKSEEEVKATDHEGKVEASEGKKRRVADKKKYKKKAEKVSQLLDDEKDSECLDLINTFDQDVALRNQKIFESKVYCLSNLNTPDGPQEALALLQECESYGHKYHDFTFNTRLCEAVSNYKCANYHEAGYQFDALALEDQTDSTRQYCNELREEIKVIIKSLEEDENEREREVGMIEAAQKTTELVVEADKTTSDVAQKTAELVVEADKTTSDVAQKTAELVVEADKTTSDVAQKTIDFVFSDSISFAMDKIDEQSYLGCMQIGSHSSHKALIILDQNQLKYLKESTYEACIKRNPFLLKSEFLIESSLSCHMSVVDPVIPINVFFERKLNDFKKSSSSSSSFDRENWWRFIRESFHSIFREVMRGLFAIHSAEKVCGDVDRSVYVTENEEGRIFYAGGDKFSKAKAGKDVQDVVSIMKDVITLICPRPKEDKFAWIIHEFEFDYKLPTELIHFFLRLEDNKVLDEKEGFEKITTWLIDPPYFWPVDHEFHCIKFLVEAFRRKVIEETSFVDFFTTQNELKGWRIKASKNALLNAIYRYKGDYHYLFGDETRAISFVHAVMNHVNDRDYDYHRGPDTLSRDEIAQLVAKVLPTIYMAIYDAVIDYAKVISVDLDALFQALKKCSSYRQEYW